MRAALAARASAIVLSGLGALMLPALIFAATDEPPAPANAPVDSAATLTGVTTTFERRCSSPELPLDGAPLPALSLDEGHMSRMPLYPPSHTRWASAKLHVLVNEEGWIRKVRVASAEGSAYTVNWMLRSLEQWRFKPRYLDGKAVCAWGTYRLTIDDTPDAGSHDGSR